MKQVGIMEAYHAYKRGETVEIRPEGKAPRKTDETRRFLENPQIPQGVNFRHYVWHFQFFTDRKPTFYIN